MVKPTKTQDLRVEKTIQVLHRFLDGSDWSRRELQETIKASYGTISILLNNLERAGVIALESMEASQGGRRAGRYRIVPSYRVFAQIEIRSYGFRWALRDMTGQEIDGGIIADDAAHESQFTREELEQLDREDRRRGEAYGRHIPAPWAEALRCMTPGALHISPSYQ